MKLLLASGLVVIAALGLLLGLRRPPPAAPAPTVQEFAALRDEVRALQMDLARLRAQAAAQLTAPPTLPATDPQGTPAATPTKAREPSRQEQLAQAEAARQTKLSALAERFAREDVDAGWSHETSRKLEALVTRHHPLGSLVSVRCARTLCQVVVAHPDPDTQRAFTQAMSDEPPAAEMRFGLDRDRTPPTTTLWLARDGHKL